MPSYILRFKKTVALLPFSFCILESERLCLLHLLKLTEYFHDRIPNGKKKQKTLFLLILITLLICPPLPPLLTLGAAAVPTMPSVLDSCSGSGPYSSMTGMVTGQ